MVSNRDKWIRIFDIPETGKHKQGFTIYKIISMLYPESCPDAVTKLTVWKRFNDFKKLHKEIRVLHKKFNIKTKIPNLPSASLFKRFDEETIKERKQSILIFLEYVGFHAQLFTSNEFVKFFETSHTPVDLLNSNINLIRADLNLPEELEYYNNSDDEHTISDTDSVTTLSSLSPSLQTLEFTNESQMITPFNKLKKLNSTISINSQTSKSSDTLSVSTTTDSLLLIDGQMYPTPPQTPGSSISGDYVQYIIDASIHVNMAVELENDKKYEEAFAAYKTAIDILLKYGKEDTNYSRKQLVRFKTEKYLIKAEKIYNMYLAPEVKNLQQIEEEIVEKPILKRPDFDLYKYKVLKIIENGMLVLHTGTQQLYYVKVIHKTMQFLNDHLILPENVPFMVRLCNHYNCENALVLVLEYCSGTKLCDFIKRQYNDDEVFYKKDNEILKQIQELSDNESENSYSDLINDYTNKKKRETKKTDIDKEQELLSSDDSFVKVDVIDVPHAKKTVKNIMDEPLPVNFHAKDLLTNDLVEKSQRLLSSVDETLMDKERKENDVGKQPKETDGNGTLKNSDTVSSQRLHSQAEAVDETDAFSGNLVIPERVVVRWAAQLLLALEKLHALGVMCRDLQSKNILIDENGDLVLTYMCNINDLCELYSKKVNMNLAPEVYTYHDVTAAADWWSYGAILYELLIGMPLSSIHSNGITSFTHIKIPKYVSLEGKSLLKQLLTYEPHERLGNGLNGIEYLKSHPFFNTVSWDTLLAKYNS